MEREVSGILSGTGGLVICGYPPRDLDRMMSFYLAAKQAGRDLVIDMRQAYLLKLFSESETLRGAYPAPDGKNIRIYIPKGEWGLIDKDQKRFTRKLLYEDYCKWQRPFLDYPNAVDYGDVRKGQRDLVVFCSDFKMNDLVDIRPDEGATYIRSLTEPFDVEMEHKEEQVRNWLTHFGVIKKEDDWHQIHVSGHGDGGQIKRIIDGADAC